MLTVEFMFYFHFHKKQSQNVSQSCNMLNLLIFMTNMQVFLCFA